MIDFGAIDIGTIPNQAYFAGCSCTGVRFMAAIRSRLGVHNLSPNQVADLRQGFGAIQAIKDNRGYQYIAGLHGVPSWYCWHHQGNARTAKHKQLFLPWHRAYLYTIEMALRDRVSTVSLPWWDWTLRPPRQNGIPQIYADPAPNPLLDFLIDLPSSNPPIHRLTRRQPGPVAGLPTQSDVDDCLGRSDWSDFTMALEDVHDAVHGWVSGDMGVIGTAAFDPIFWAHHTMIDRIWWLWQVRHGNGDVPTALLDVVLTPFNFKVRDVLNVQDLGYDYAAAQGTVVSSGGSQ
jgi:tyrosinase